MFAYYIQSFLQAGLGSRESLAVVLKFIHYLSQLQFADIPEIHKKVRGMQCGSLGIDNLYIRKEQN